MQHHLPPIHLRHLWRKWTIIIWHLLLLQLLRGWRHSQSPWSSNSLLPFSLPVHAATNTTTFTPPETLKLALIAPLNLPNPNTNAFGQPALFIFHTAIKYLNDASSAWRANQSLPMPLLPYTTLVPLWYDSRSDPGTSVNVASDAISAGAVAVLGEFLSPLCQQIQYICARYHVPQFSPSCTAMEFTRDHAAVYPYFIRNVPSVSLQAQLMTHLIGDYFGWKKIAIFYASDPFGTGGAQSMMSTAASLGITILATASFNIGDVDMSFQIRRIVESNARIIAFWGLVGDFQTLLRQIRFGAANNLWPDLLCSGYQWIGDHAITTAALYTNSSGDIMEDITHLIPGLLSLNYYVNHTRPEYQEFQRVQQAAPYWNVTPIVKANSSTSAAPVIWDSVIQVAMGIDWMLQHELDPTVYENRPTFYEAIRNRTFIGASGPIQINADGDRLRGFGVFNYQRASKTFVNVGLLSLNGTFTKFSTVPAIEFMGADKYLQPLDTPARSIRLLTERTQIGLIAFTCILILSFVGVQICIFLNRDQNLIKGGSPLFLYLFIIGVQLLCASVIPRALEDKVEWSPHPCECDLWLTNLGYTLIAGSLFVKTYRLQSIFNMNQLNSNKQLSIGILISILCSFLILETALLLGLQYGAPLSIRIQTFDRDEDYYACRAGSSADNNLVRSVITPVTVATRFALLIATAFMAFKVRNIPSTFNESKQLGVTIYNLLFLSVLLPAIDAAMGRGKETALIVYAICVFLICTLSLGIMVVPKFVIIYYAMKKDQAKQLSAINRRLELTQIPADPTSTRQTLGRIPEEISRQWRLIQQLQPSNQVDQGQQYPDQSAAKSDYEAVATHPPHPGSNGVIVEGTRESHSTGLRLTPSSSEPYGINGQGSVPATVTGHNTQLGTPETGDSAPAAVNTDTIGTMIPSPSHANRRVNDNSASSTTTTPHKITIHMTEEEEAVRIEESVHTSLNGHHDLAPSIVHPSPSSMTQVIEFFARLAPADKLQLLTQLQSQFMTTVRLTPSSAAQATSIKQE